MILIIILFLTYIRFKVIFRNKNTFLKFIKKYFMQINYIRFIHVALFIKYYITKIPKPIKK